ncbi:MAG TPA: hypothetical protein VNM14_00960 [Planctomycetota bacterium]|jgi:hypothetical protein|nr:hypothetical protein [Planctomycetota bacterium]
MPTVHGPLPPSAPDALKVIACACNKSVAQKTKDQDLTCTQLGTKKHSCCEKAIRDHKKTKKPPRLGGERGFERDGTPLKKPRWVLAKSGKLPAKSVWPDACSTDAKGNPTKFYDFKFRCPKGTKTKQQPNGKWLKKGGSRKQPTWTTYDDGETQDQRIKEVGAAQNPPVTKDPEIVDTSNCP